MTPGRRASRRPVASGIGEGEVADLQPVRVTVAFPTIGRWSLLRQALQSILRNPRRDVRVVVVDNASGDETRTEISKLLKEDARLRYVRYEERVHPHANWNRCIEAAGGADYLAIFHDDDLYEPEILDRQIEFLDRHPSVGFVGTGYWIIDERGEVRGSSSARRVGGVIPGKAFIRDLMRRAGSFITCPSVMYRKIALEPIGFDAGVDPRGGDYLTWLKMAERWDVGYIPTPLMRYRRHARQGSASAGLGSGTVAVFRNLSRYASSVAENRPERRAEAEAWIRAVRRRCLARLLSYGLEDCGDSPAERVRFVGQVSEICPVGGGVVAKVGLLIGRPLKRWGLFRIAMNLLRREGGADRSAPERSAV